MNNYDEEQWHNYLYTQYERRLCEEVEEPTPPSTSDINLYDLMGDDYYPYLSKDVNGDYTLTVEDFDNVVVAEDTQINPCAVDGFAEFCQRFLTSYERIKQQK